jgi:glycine/D-amino acid oxidase-like deaminating enzyme
LESSKSVEIPQQPDWILPSKINSYKVIGTPQNSAQVHPYLLTTAILNLAKASGVNVIIGSATSLNYSNNGRSIDGVTYSEDRIAKTLAATDVILAAGPWTPNIFSAAKLKASRAHSIVIRPSRALTSHVLFVEPRNGLHKGISAEIYPRPDNTVYIGKSADYDSPLPATTGDVEVDTALTKYLRVAMGSISNEISDGELLVEQVCFKASIRDHQDGEEVGPIIGAVGVEGLWIATGHDEWGIQNAPATGLVMSEMIFDGDAKSADCRTLDPSLFLSK